MVGTPRRSDALGRHEIEQALRIELGSREHHLRPTAAQACGSPHALAWNMGTTGSTVSFIDIASESAMQAASA